MNRRTLSLLGAAVLLTTTVISGATAGAADVERHCSVSFSANPANVGQEVTISATGFDANETFDVIYSQDGTKVGGNSNSADAGGNYSGSFVVGDPLAGITLGYAFTGETSGATCTGALGINAVNPPASVGVITADPTTTSTAPAAKAAAVRAAPAFTG